MLLFADPSDGVCKNTCRGMVGHLKAAPMGDRGQALQQDAGGMDVGRVPEPRREMRRAHRLGVVHIDDVELPIGQSRHVGSGSDGPAGRLRIIRSYGICLDHWPPPFGSGRRPTGPAEAGADARGLR